MKINQNKYKKENIKKDNEVCRTEWQEYAKQTIEDFALRPPATIQIFSHAKRRINYLKRHVESLKESQSDLKRCGGLLMTIINLQHNFVRTYLLKEFSEEKGNDIFFNQYMKLSKEDKKKYFNKLKKLTKNK